MNGVTVSLSLHNPQEYIPLGQYRSDGQISIQIVLVLIHADITDFIVIKAELIANMISEIFSQHRDA